MAFGTMEKIETVTVGSGGAASIIFSSIPQTYNDLLIKISARNQRNSYADDFRVTINNNTSATYSTRRLYGNGSNALTDSGSSSGITYSYSGQMTSSTATASTFGNCEFYFANYSSSGAKSWSAEGVAETNSTTSQLAIYATFTSDANPITIIKLEGYNNQVFEQHTTATLYGISRVPTSAKATGGVITDDASYWYHTFTSSGIFTPNQTITGDILVVAGGGGASGGGGGAGGLLGFTAQSLIVQNYSVTIGAGGSGQNNVTTNGSNGSDSQFGALTLVKGGGGGSHQAGGGVPGSQGSGGGAGYDSSVGTATSNQGNNGGAAVTTGQRGCGGGGGAGAVGDNGTITSGGNGGNGTSAYSSWGLATGTGQRSSETFYYSGGGGGGNFSTDGIADRNGYGGLGGGGNAATNLKTAGTAGTANTGGGGGGATDGPNPTTGSAGGAGGSGIVIVRYAK